MRTVAILAFCCGLTTLHAQAVVSSDQPPPKALLTAKNAYVINNNLMSGEDDELLWHLNHWGRFKIVGDLASSDITITLGVSRPIVGTTIAISDSRTNKELWRAKLPPIFSGQPGPRQRRAATIRLVEHLREQLERKWPEPKEK